MRISFYVPGYAYSVKTERLVRNSSALSLLDGWKYGGGNMYDYLDVELVDQGVIGGTIRTSWTPDKGLEVVTDYWVPDSLRPLFIDRLRDETVAQLSDGIGEGGFEINLQGQEFILVADTDKQPELEQVYDGKPVPVPSKVARAARDGNVALLREAVDSGEAIDSTIQGLTGLQLAIIYGHSECAILLISKGSDVNITMHDGDETPLHLCFVEFPE